ncbi:MAG TPA: MgtC/SapB family protein [Sedimentibacter sp.]|jgi:putative Mg2+ transporter-C (MgtC) family protein|nr:MgtC/SapB family protein [Sedimentibacter sp.]HOG63065.1 MgtC/SapB family protein [Sedimentibacter sp.]HPY56063.1 MgtC/SapB family protein [Sedimentibacter sp.]HQC69921.1 MgtC/SapB family protein [Sedimentibacter sp.]HQK53085.1 MgtC/SapB family protein [Sedimentibacter sp.]
MICGGIIGLERSRKNRPAGFRTYMIVCLSSALVMMTNQYIYNNFSGSDPARLGAQVISGIGFLGAGTIMITSRNQIKGLTSAAGLWASACLGLAIGVGFYSGAVIVALIVFIIITFFKKIDYMLTSNNRIINIYTSFKSIEQLDKFIIFCNLSDFKVRNIEITKDTIPHEISVIAIITLEAKERMNHVDVIQKLNSFEGLVHIEEL